MSIDEKGQPMRKREAVVEAMRSAMEAVRDEKRPGVTYFLIPQMAEAALDAAISALSEPDEGMWDGLPRDIMMWLDMGEKTPASLSKHLEHLGQPEPAWLEGESEWKAKNKVPSKGTRCVWIWKAMLSTLRSPEK